MYIAISRIASVVNAIYIACWHPMLIAFRPQMRCSSDWLVGCCSNPTYYLSPLSAVVSQMASLEFCSSLGTRVDMRRGILSIRTEMKDESARKADRKSRRKGLEAGGGVSISLSSCGQTIVAFPALRYLFR